MRRMRSPLSKWLFPLASCALVLVAPLAHGVSVAAIQTTNGTAYNFTPAIASAGLSGTLGWKFSVGSQNISVTSLGVFDSGSNGLLISHPVGIWLATGALQASTTVQAGTASSLSNGYRYETISPLTLLANTSYIIGAYYPADVAEPVIAISSQTIGSAITYTKSSISQLSPTGSFTVPLLNGGVDQGFFGPNFQYTVVSAPEPSSLLLGGLGVLGCFRRRRA